MASKRRPFWTLDCESDPFEEDKDAIARRACPTCGAERGKLCGGGSKREVRLEVTHQARRRVPQPFIWGLYGGESGEDYYEFDTVSDVVRFLESKSHIVYAHNGGKFDYHYLRDYINTGEAISIIAGRLAKFRIGVCEFRDSMNILPVSLATFKKDEVDYAIFEPEERDKPANREIIRKYLRSDCSYLYELIQAHRKENGVALTQAGASMRAWSKQSGIKPPRQSSALYQLYKPYYYGGRVQCFASGVVSRDFKVIDINSAYPHAMLSAHPYSPEAVWMDHLPADGELHKCLITLSCTARGCFPYRTDTGDLYFPHDEHTIRRYHITGYEFVTALRRDAIKNIIVESVHYFPQSVKFEEFILSNWDRRARAKAEGNKALDIIVKLLMNSLYGKFASDYNKYRDYHLIHREQLPDYEVNGYAESAYWGNDKFLMGRPIPEEKHRFFNIATAASITGYVRAMLFDALCSVTDPLYCDTDSIACADTGKLLLGEALGAWKVEGEFDGYAIAGKKMYAFHKKDEPRTLDLTPKGEYANYKVACKGVDLDPWGIERVASGNSVTYSPAVPTYSAKRAEPLFTPREVRLTAKDIRIIPPTKEKRQ
jgi:hypothetical protein